MHTECHFIPSPAVKKKDPGVIVKASNSSTAQS
jgi:hypothetical protein